MKNDYRDYLEHGIYKYVKKLFKNGKTRYIYPDDLKTKFGKKIYNQTVTWKQAEADRNARSNLVVKDISTGKKISNNIYVDHKNNFNIPDNYNKHQTAVTTYWKDSKGNKHQNRVQTNTGDDMITGKDLINTVRRNAKNKINYAKFKSRKNFEKFLEKVFGYKDPRKVKSEIENREFNKRIDKAVSNKKISELKTELRNIVEKTDTKKLKRLKRILKPRKIKIDYTNSHGKGKRG